MTSGATGGNWRRLAGATWCATGFGCHFVYLLLILCTRNDICAARVCVRGILCPFSQSRLGHQKQAVPHLPQLQSSQHAPNDLPRPRQPPMWAKGKEKKTIYWKLWCNVQSEFGRTLRPSSPYATTLLHPLVVTPYRVASPKPVPSCEM